MIARGTMQESTPDMLADEETMNINQILQAIDKQIATLQQARALFADDVPADPTVPAGKRRGRPPGSGKNIAASPTKKPRKTFSPEARAKIAAAQKARWAAAKKPEAA